MKRGFTLIELLMVVGIMSFLGVAATGGYSALQRGMAERSAVAAVSSLLKAAKERALVDRSPTVVFCYNRLLNEKSDTENAVVVGEAVAVRRAGRVSWTSGNYIADEFMDVVGSYDIIPDGESSNRKGMKLWWFGDQKITSMKYSIVADALIPLFDNQASSLKSFRHWAEGENDPGTNMHCVVYAFKTIATGSHSPQWRSGNGYGFEFATVQLPKNFIFGDAVPATLGDIRESDPIYFEGDPSNVSDGRIKVQFCRPDASGFPKPVREAGVASSEENQTI